MRWDEIEGDIWTIPAEKTKNKKEHKVPLSSQAKDILVKLKTQIGEKEYIFPSGESHIRWLRRSNKAVQDACKFHFTPHDLRRTAATEMSKMGMDDVIIAKILNHSWVERQVTSVYNRWQKLPEMRQALARWGNRLDQILSDLPT